ncbi:MAG: sugar-binding domain-containing protein [Armatimonadota bacterium]
MKNGSVLGITALAVMMMTTCCGADMDANGLRKIGGFRCVDIKSSKNDNTYNLYDIGYFAYAGFSMDIWKRHGVPFWYPQDTGNIRVAGAQWKPKAATSISSAWAGAVAGADHQQPGNGAIANANDGDDGTYWFAGENRPNGKLWINFKGIYRVNGIRFRGWATPRHAPKDYSVGLILPDGTEKEIAAVIDEKRMGGWFEFPVGNIDAKGVYINVITTMEAQNGPVIYELQATGEGLTSLSYPSEVLIPLKGTPAQEILFLGHVGEGFDTTPEVETAVGEYVLRYTDGFDEVVPLVAGKNIASSRYGHFVPEAEFAFGFRDAEALNTDPVGSKYYHLDEMLPVHPRRQLMMFSYTPKRQDMPIDSLTFRCTNPQASLVLAGLTIRQSGPRMNALVYKGKVTSPYPKNTPKAKPSLVGQMQDNSKPLSLDGDWKYTTDPGNLGIRHSYFKPGSDESSWKSMPVPSQWYVHGVDYHGVVWFSRKFDVPASFPGSTLELNFGGVDYDARVWVNGEYVGRHVGAFSSFKLDATKAIRKGEQNLIVVRVDSPVDPGYSPQKTIIKGNSQDDICMPYNEEGCTGGIFRSVTLVGHGDVGIQNVWTSSTVSKDLKHADVDIKLELQPSASSDELVTVKCILTEPAVKGRKSRVFTSEQQLDMKGTTPVELKLPIDDPLLWFPWEQGAPNMHNMVVEVRRGTELLDRHVSRVGLREVDLVREEKCIYVNHHRIFIKGMLNDDIHWMSMMDRTGYRQRIQLQKDANLNLIRMVGHQSSPDMYELCDEMGMMIWQEMPLQWGYSTTEPIRDDIMEIVSDTVKQCRPYASVIGWSAWNEGGQPGFSERITQSIVQLDGSRPMTNASGYGDFDIHIYPNIIPSQMARRSFFWSGISVGFVSEVGAYGLSSLSEMQDIVGKELFPFASADYYWETFNSYRYNDGPVFWDSPSSGDWSTEKIRKYVMDKIAPSERWLQQFMKFMYEHFRAMRFSPTTAAIHCRFDDPLPTAFLGVVNFNGKPRKAYYSVKQACQQVLPILFFDFEGASDVRVVNEYWHKSWMNCTLKLRVTDRAGKQISLTSKRFDLPADATTQIISRKEIGDIFHIPGGFYAYLTVADNEGKLISENSYDLTAEEIEAFVTSVYPVPPVRPINSVVLTAGELDPSIAPRAGADTFSSDLLHLGGAGKPSLLFTAELPADGYYLIRAACDSGAQLRQYELTVDGVKAELESYPYTDMSLGVTRLPYSPKQLSWYPGWSAKLTKGMHQIELRWTGAGPAPSVAVDAFSLQHTSNPNTRGYGSDYKVDASTTDNKNLK